MQSKKIINKDKHCENNELISNLLSIQMRFIQMHDYFVEALKCFHDCKGETKNEFDDDIQNAYKATQEGYEVIILVLGQVESAIKIAKAGEFSESEAKAFMNRAEEYICELDESIHEQISIEKINYQ